MKNNHKENNLIMHRFVGQKFVMLFATSLLAAAMPFNIYAEDQLPQMQQVGEITFITGGIAEESAMMQKVAKEYPLEIIVIEKSKEREAYLADVSVQLLDNQKNVVLDTTTEGPYLYVNLPAGQYWVVATFNGEVKKQKVRVRSNQHQKIVFWWPMKVEQTIEAPQPEESIKAIPED